jgi:hypothetical protein
MSYNTEYKSLKDLNYVLVKRATMVADETCIMRGLANMRWNKVDNSTEKSDGNAEFIAANDMSNKNACVDSIKTANAALVLKTKEMEGEFDKLNCVVQTGL